MKIISNVSYKLKTSQKFPVKFTGHFGEVNNNDIRVLIHKTNNKLF